MKFVLNDGEELGLPETIQRLLQRVTELETEVTSQSELIDILLQRLNYKEYSNDTRNELV